VSPHYRELAASHSSGGGIFEVVPVLLENLRTTGLQRSYTVSDNKYVPTLRTSALSPSSGSLHNGSLRFSVKQFLML